jgi:hypothetical protein
VRNLRTHLSKDGGVVYLIATLVAWCSLQTWAATVSTQTFGRYEIMLQEGLPVAAGEILGTVRRQTGLPEYPLVLRTQQRKLELGILGPGNRPIRLASTTFAGPRGDKAATVRFSVERSLRQDDTLTLWLRQVKASRQFSLALDLRDLERMLEGPR